jgi:hypothetical protein
MELDYMGYPLGTEAIRALWQPFRDAEKKVREYEKVLSQLVVDGCTDELLKKAENLLNSG